MVASLISPFQNLELDHITPRSHGGPDTDDNLQLLCGYCNRVKGDRPMEYLISKVRAWQDERATPRPTTLGKQAYNSRYIYMSKTKIIFIMLFATVSIICAIAIPIVVGAFILTYWVL